MSTTAQTLQLGLAALVTAVVVAPAAGAGTGPAVFTPPGPNLGLFVAREQLDVAIRHVAKHSKHRHNDRRRSG